ncbi:MAG: MBOAT family protein, partial [Psychrosphaera sp.]|nr:MBOAT family protein [Psychrosphaera sp.]
MLFSSYEFILLFLPIVIVLYYSIQKYSFAVANSALVGASLFFYAWWEPKYLLLLLLSMAGNFYVGRQLLPIAGQQSVNNHQRKWLLTASIVLNLGLLGYFKYAFFIATNIDAVAGTVFSPAVTNIVLPLAISFFTFQQIAYLVDSYKGLRIPESFVNYALFISFFPQLIAGPIVHHNEMMSQFSQQKRLDWNNITRGLMIFMVGLFKKVVFADNVAPYANKVFGAAQTGVDLTFFEAWGGALAYTFQLYFDFSGYADMAIGAALMFGIYLPLNFNSPYKSVNIIEFWRRWHMTLGRFLRDYVYIPLGGYRSGN